VAKHVENEAADRAAQAQRRRREIKSCDELLRRLKAAHGNPSDLRVWIEGLPTVQQGAA